MSGSPQYTIGVYENDRCPKRARSSMVARGAQGIDTNGAERWAVLAAIETSITNAASESINSKIQWVKYTARGFRNKTNFVTAIYFHCGGLDLTFETH